MNDHTLLQFIQGKPLPNEKKSEIIDWIEASDANRAQYNKLKNLWVLTGVSKVTPHSAARFFKNEDVEASRRRIYLNTWLRYAAVVVISLLVGGVIVSIFKHQQVSYMAEDVFEFRSGEQSNSQVILPDGSEVKLNINSKITYRHDKVAHERYITLEGEAYFDVVHDENWPFIIDFDKLKVYDVGTAFNVEAIKDEDRIVTTLVEGLVDLHYGSDQTVNLKPGQEAIYYKSENKIDVAQANINNVLGWQNNRFVFRDESFETVVNKIAEWHDIVIEWEDEKIKTKRLHYIVERDVSLERAMLLLRRSIPFEYKFTKNDGVITRVKICKNN